MLIDMYIHIVHVQIKDKVMNHVIYICRHTCNSNPSVQTIKQICTNQSMYTMFIPVMIF